MSNGLDGVPNWPLVAAGDMDKLTAAAVMSGVVPVCVLVRVPLKVRRKAVLAPMLTEPIAAPPIREIQAASCWCWR